MAATGYTPISLYYSTTAATAPLAANLVNGELAINITDGKLYYKDNAGVVQIIAGKGGAGVAGGSNTQVQYNSSGSLAGSANLTFNGTTLTANTLNLTNALGVSYGGTGLTSLTAGYIPYGNGTSAFSSASTFNYNATSGLGVNGLTLVYNTNLYATDGTLSNYSSANNVYLNGNAAAGLSLSGDGSLSTRINIYATSANYMAFFTASAERMRIDSSGNLLVGATAQFNSCKVGIKADIGAYNILSIQNSSASLGVYVGFLNSSATTVGSISYNGAATLYNATSDYRLKNVIGDVTDSGQRLDALEPIEYDWKSGYRTRGFLAHKFAEVYPNSVTGEKDAVDAEGKPIYQAMQASSPEVMADLIAEIQSLRKRVAQLESK